MRWWVADLHFGHTNVLTYCNRPFKDAYHMNEVLISNWNESVGTSDDVWFVGDMMMNHGYLHLLNRLNFGQLYWILGNHDKEKRIQRELSEGCLYGLKDGIHLMKDAVETIGGVEYFITHRPINSSDNMPTICGHVHEKWKFLATGTLISEYSRALNRTVSKVIKQPILNVGVDVHGFKPISDEEVVKYFKY